MKAEIIAIGSELLTPDNIDTNSLFMTQALNAAGCPVHLKTIVGDVHDDIAGALRAGLQRSDLIILSGGLGPTEDDLTREAVASVLNRPMAVDAAILETLSQRFAARGFRMAKINEKQANVIQGAETIDNPRGTAPGMWIEERGRYIALLPGPPREMKLMIEQSVLPKVRQLAGPTRLASRSFHITGITESELDSQISPIYKAYPQIQTTVLAGTRHISVKLYQWIKVDELPEAMDELAKKLQDKLGDSIFSITGESMEEVVGKLLKEKGETLAVAESCTGGMLGMCITKVSGSSIYFLGGIQCYSNEAKIKLCQVPEETIKNYGAVSAETAEALACGVRNAFGSTYGISITGIAGPEGGSAEKPVGLVYIGFSDGSRVESRHRIMPGDRESIRERSTYLALSWLRRKIMNQEQ